MANLPGARIRLALRLLRERPYMTSAQRAQFKKLLQSLESDLHAKSPTKIEPNRAAEEEAGTREDEQPLNEMLQTIASSRNRNLDGVLKRVRRALDKLTEEPDSFGDCEDCGEEIPAGRLKAMPYAELCVGCQEKQDGPKTLPTRRKLTDYR
jgi:DnaK suppressor protein